MPAGHMQSTVVLDVSSMTPACRSKSTSTFHFGCSLSYAVSVWGTSMVLLPLTMYPYCRQHHPGFVSFGKQAQRPVRSTIQQHATWSAAYLQLCCHLPATCLLQVASAQCGFQTHFNLISLLQLTTKRTAAQLSRPTCR